MELTLFVLLWFSFAYFHHTTPGWNVNSRLALTYALVEQGTVRIDDYRNHRDVATDDVAFYRGHYYSDKIIGTSLLGVPAFAAVRLLELARDERFGWNTRRYLVTAIAIGFIAAASGVVLFRLLMLYQRRWFQDVCVTGPLVVTLLHFFGTQAFFYSTLFMSYLPAQFFILAALLLLERAWDAGRVLPMFSVGLLVGAALLCEYTVGIVAAGVGIYALYALQNRLHIWRYAAGAVLGVVPFALYCYAIFGKFAIPYEYERNELFREYMSRGFMGASVPKPAVFWLITFHPFRGIFAQSPQLLLALVGVGLMFGRSAWRPLALVITFLTIAYLTFNSAYYMWWGGFSFGPRHLLPMLPFLCIPMLILWRCVSGRVALLLAGAYAVVVHLIVNATEPQFPDRGTGVSLDELLFPKLTTDYGWPFISHHWPAFWRGISDDNFGTFIGLPPGPLSLLPLLLVWIAAVVILRLRARRQ